MSDRALPVFTWGLVGAIVIAMKLITVIVGGESW
jgi:hypothetical protein